MTTTSSYPAKIKVCIPLHTHSLYTLILQLPVLPTLDLTLDMSRRWVHPSAYTLVL